MRTIVFVLYSDLQNDIISSSENKWDWPVYTAHRVGRVPSLFLQSSELGLPQPLTHAGERAPPPFGSGMRGTLAGERGGGRVPIPRRGHGLWYSLYIRTLWYCIYLAQLRPRQAPMTHLCEAKARSRNHTDVSRLRSRTPFTYTIRLRKDDFFLKGLSHEMDLAFDDMYGKF